MTDLDPGLEISGTLHALLGIGSRLEAMHRSLQRANELAAQAALLTPSSTVQPASGIFLTGIPLVLDLGGPAQGHVWDVRRIVVGGVLPTTAATGVADVYASAAGPSQQPSSLIDWVDRAAALPLSGFYGAGDVGVRYPEHLYAIVTAATNGQTYLAGARVVDRIESPATRSVESVGS